MYEDVCERLWLAVTALALAEGSRWQRLAYAYMPIFHLRAEDFADEESRIKFSALKDTISARGTIERTTRAMSDDQVEAAIRAILELDQHCRRA